MVSIEPMLRNKKKENKEEVFSAIDLHQVFRFFSFFCFYSLPYILFFFLFVTASIDTLCRDKQQQQQQQRQHRCKEREKAAREQIGFALD